MRKADISWHFAWELNHPSGEAEAACPHIAHEIGATDDPRDLAIAVHWHPLYSVGCQQPSNFTDFRVSRRR